ncbi:hypothetical protein Tco_0337237 [Tanacetum coccineum]
MPNTRSGATMTREGINEQINHQVAEALEAHDVARNLEPLAEGGDEQENVNGNGGVNGNGNGGVNGNGNGGVNGNGGGNDNGNDAFDSPYLLVLITRTSQSRQHESSKSPITELFDVNSGRISIVTVNTKEYHYDVLAIITKIMHRTLDNSL